MLQPTFRSAYNSYENLDEIISSFNFTKYIYIRVQWL